MKLTLILVGLCAVVVLVLALRPKEPGPTPEVPLSMQNGAAIDALKIQLADVEKSVAKLKKLHTDAERSNAEFLAQFEAQVKRAGIPKLPGVK